MIEQKAINEMKKNKMRTQLDMDLATHEERRKQKIQMHLSKVQTNLERVKIAKQRAQNKENIDMNDEGMKQNTLMMA